MNQPTRSLGLAALALPLVPLVGGSGFAQQRLLEIHLGAEAPGFGEAVAFTDDLDGDGRPNVLVGDPQRGAWQTGGGSVRVQLGAGWGEVTGDDDEDLLGSSVATGLELDGLPLSDFVVGAPGDDDQGAECGSVTAYASDRSLLFRLFGTGAGDELGTSVATVGDLDGDGFDEFLVGAPQEANGGAGYAWLVSGQSGSVLHTFQGQAPGDRCGRGLAGLGDVDADGLPDFAIGAPGALGRGLVRVYSGASLALLREHQGTAPGDEFGFALAGGSDVDRDSIRDLIVGVPRSGAAIGATFVYSGVSGAPLLELAGELVDGRFGHSVAGAGDFDGDGFGDVVVGAPGVEAFDQPTLAGTGSVYSGRDASLLMRVGGGHSWAGTGVAVAGGGDLDGNGLGDVIIGSFANNDGYGSRPYVTVHGVSKAERVLSGPNDSHFGASLATLDDLDGDGRPELLVGAPFANGPAGAYTGSVRVQTLDGDLLHEFFGDAPGDQLGAAVADAGDVDGDGTRDLIVGAAMRTFGAPFGGGYARVFSGATGAVLHTFVETGVGGGFGGAVAGGGDVDGDGYDDLIVGGALRALDQGNLSGFDSDGSVRVYSGHSGALLHAIDEPAGYPREAWGASVAILDDLDGDGRAEFAFGAPDALLTVPNWTWGFVSIHSGANGARLETFTSFDLRTGSSLLPVDDLDGDGRGDLLVGSWDPQGIHTDGSVMAVSTADFGVLWRVEESTAYVGLGFGYALAQSGDHDGDGVADLLVGVPGRLTHGARAIGAVHLRSGVDGEWLNTFVGNSGWDYLGYSLAGLGDVDGDGTPDFAMGAPAEWRHNQGSENGLNRVYVRLSDELRAHHYCARNANSTGLGGRLDATGSSRVSRALLELDASDLPSGQFGAFVCGPTSLEVPFLAGYRCVGSAARLGPPQASDASGRASLAIDFGAAPANAIAPGSSWSFQFWHRDTVGLVNTTDALRIDFLP